MYTTSHNAAAAKPPHPPPLSHRTDHLHEPYTMC